MRAAAMESDSFKFHIRKLVKIGYIIKAEDGLYELTAEGKALASRLDRPTAPADTVTLPAGECR